jgi:hypothetical protein
MTAETKQMGFLLSCKNERRTILMILKQVMSYGLFTNINLIICLQGAKWSDSKRKRTKGIEKVILTIFSRANI